MQLGHWIWVGVGFMCTGVGMLTAWWVGVGLFAIIFGYGITCATQAEIEKAEEP